MLKDKEKAFRRLCKEPVLYLEAHKLLGKESEAENVCGEVLEAVIEGYPILEKQSYNNLLHICRISIRYRCIGKLEFINESDEKIPENISAASDEHIHMLIRNCGSDILLQVLKELQLDKRCILILRYGFDLKTDIIATLLGVSGYQVLKELEAAGRIMAESLSLQSVSTAYCNKTEAYLSYQTGN